MKTRSTNFIKESELAWGDLGAGITRQIMGYDGQLMLVKVKFEKGAIGYLHNHFHSQCTYVASGTFEVTINGKIEVLQPGDGFYTEPNTPHCLSGVRHIDGFFQSNAS